MKFNAIELGTQKPNRNDLFDGKQYTTNFFSYLDFCRNIAESEGLKDYVSLTFDEISVTKQEEKPQDDDKPSDSYALMIYKALEASAEGKLTLAEIYSWIESHYTYYQTADPVWKNSIRHNLSLNPIFKKIPRPSNFKGKGGFWAIDVSQKNSKLLKSKKDRNDSENRDLSKDYINFTNNRIIF